MKSSLVVHVCTSKGWVIHSDNYGWILHLLKRALKQVCILHWWDLEKPAHRWSLALNIDVLLDLLSLSADSWELTFKPFPIDKMNACSCDFRFICQYSSLNFCTPFTLLNLSNQLKFYLYQIKPNFICIPPKHNLHIISLGLDRLYRCYILYVDSTILSTSTSTN